MKDLFIGYHKPTDEEFGEMWKRSIFGFDANMLLNVYRFTPQSREKFFAVLERLKEKIWLPRQAATEYFKNRENVIQGQLKIYEEIHAKLDGDLGKLAKQLEEAYKKHPSINIESVVKPIKNALKKAQVSLKKDKANHPDFSVADPLRDRILARLYPI